MPKKIDLNYILCWNIVSFHDVCDFVKNKSLGMHPKVFDRSIITTLSILVFTYAFVSLFHES